MKELRAQGKISGIVSSDEAEETMPAPDIFGLALERAGVSQRTPWWSATRSWDIQAAKEAGVRVAAVMTGGAFSRAELEEAGAYAVYEDCHELLNDGYSEKLNPSDS